MNPPSLPTPTVLCVPVLWPALARASYERWRVPALAAMRLALMGMPFQFSVRVFNSLAPGVATGRFAGLRDAYAMLNGGAGIGAGAGGRVCRAGSARWPPGRASHLACPVLPR